MEIIVPRSADVRVSADSGIGRIDLFAQDDRSSGFFPGIGTGPWTDDGDPEIELTIHAGVGDVEVSRA